MRIIVLVVMVISFLIVGFSTFTMPILLNSHTEDVDYEQVEGMIETMEQAMDEMEESGMEISEEMEESYDKVSSFPSKGRVTFSKILSIISGLLSLIVIVFAFMKKEIVSKIGILAILLGLLTYIVSPSIDGGAFGAANPAKMTLLAFSSILVTSGLAIYSYKLSKK